MILDNELDCIPIIHLAVLNAFEFLSTMGTKCKLWQLFLIFIIENEWEIHEKLNKVNK